MTINKKLDKEYGDGSKRGILIIEDHADGVTYIPGMEEIKGFIQSEVEVVFNEVEKYIKTSHLINPMAREKIIEDLANIFSNHGFDLLKK